MGRSGDEWDGSERSGDEWVGSEQSGDEWDGSERYGESVSNAIPLLLAYVLWL